MQIVQERLLARNSKRDLDAVQKQKLGIYVYALINPKDNEVIYIGKGGGDTDGTGNERIFAHFDEAESKLDDKSDKLERIRSVWKEGQDIRWVIVRHGLSSAEEAHKIEQSLIDLLNISKNGKTANKVSGHGSKEFGLLDEQGVTKLAAPNVAPSKECVVLVFTIQKSIKGKGGVNAKADDVYEATRKSWSVNLKELERLGCVYAVGIDDGYSLGAYKIKEWEVKKYEGKHGFIKDVEDDVCEELLHRNWTDLLEPLKKWRQRGSIPWIQFNGDGKYQHLKGSDAVKGVWYALEQNP